MLTNMKLGIIMVCAVVILSFALMSCGDGQAGEQSFLQTDDYMNYTVPEGWSKMETGDASTLIMKDPEKFPYIAIYIESLDTFKGKVYESIDEFESEWEWVSNNEDIEQISKKCETVNVDGRDFLFAEEVYKDSTEPDKTYILRSYEKEIDGRYYQISLETDDEKDLKAFDDFMNSIVFVGE